MNNKTRQNLDIFSDKKYWTPVKKKLFRIMSKGSSNLDYKELGKKIGKTENTVERYLSEPPFQEGMLKMGVALQVQYSIQTIKSQQETLNLLREEVVKRVSKLRLKGILKTIKILESSAIK